MDVKRKCCIFIEIETHPPHPPTQKEPLITQMGADIGRHPPGSRIQRTAPSSEKRQVPSFALLELGRRIETRVEANNAKGGS
jgi:hypothetical protein